MVHPQVFNRKSPCAGNHPGSVRMYVSWAKAANFASGTNPLLPLNTWQPCHVGYRFDAWDRHAFPLVHDPITWIYDRGKTGWTFLIRIDHFDLVEEALYILARLLGWSCYESWRRILLKLRIWKASWLGILSKTGDDLKKPSGTPPQSALENHSDKNTELHWSWPQGLDSWW